MTAMEKVAWTELLVSVAAVVVASVLFPWLGGKAHVGFGLLGLVVCSVWFVRRRGQRVVIDERDRAIEQRATQLGVQAALYSSDTAWNIPFFLPDCRRSGVLSGAWYLS